MNQFLSPSQSLSRFCCLPAAIVLFFFPLLLHGQNILWKNDLTQTDSLISAVFGPAWQSCSLQGRIRNQTFGKGPCRLTVVDKKICDENTFLLQKNLKLQFYLEGTGNKYCYFNAALPSAITVTPGIYFTGYLNDGGMNHCCFKLCPTIQVTRLKTGKKTTFNLRPGGFSPRNGMISQHKTNWFLTQINIHAEAKQYCQKNNLNFNKPKIIGWSLLGNNLPPNQSFTVHLEGTKIFQAPALDQFFSQKQTNLALHKPYTLNMPPNAFPEGYNGNPMCGTGNAMTKLTDGELASKCWFDARTAGWWTDKQVNITIDLGKSHNIDTVAFRMSTGYEGNGVPPVCRIFISDSPETFLLVRSAQKKQLLDQWRKKRDFGLMDGNPHAWLALDHLQARGRYVTLSLQSTGNLYLDEIAVLKAAQPPPDDWRKSLLVCSTPDCTPFYKQPYACLADNIPTPLILNFPDWQHGYSLYVDLPETLTIIAPKAVFHSDTTFRGKHYRRFRVDNVRELYFRTTLPIGSQTRIKLTGICDSKGRDLSSLSQILTLNIINIPEICGFQRLICSVTFADYHFWNRWPDAIRTYKKMGLNLFAPFSHSDLYAMQNKKFFCQCLKMIQEARAAGLRTGGNRSPYCNSQINSSSLKRKAVFLNSGTPSAINCPRVYLSHVLSRPDNEDAVAMKNAAVLGLDYLFLDSEPFWPGPVCRCSQCEHEWTVFTRKKHIPHKTLKEIWNTQNSVYQNHVQNFWDEFYTNLWEQLKRELKKNSVSGKTPMTGLYSLPEISGNTYGNKARFSVLAREKLVDFGNSTLYNYPLHKVAGQVRALHRKLPPGMPLYLWVTAGDHSMSLEQSPDDLRNQLFLIYANGAQGAIFYSALGVDAADYAVIGEVISILRPWENLIADGSLTASEQYTVPQPWHASGITTGNQTLLAVSKYDAEGGELSIQCKKKILNARLLTGGRLHSGTHTLSLKVPSGNKNTVQLIILNH